MKERQNDLLTISVVAVLLLLFTVADLTWEFSALFGSRNQTAAGQKTEGTADFLNGRLTTSYQEKVHDHFINRHKWDTLRRDMESLMGKKDLNGLYFGKDGFYFQQHFPENYPEKRQEEGLAFLEKMAQEQDAVIMLIPTADELLQEKLPLYAEIFNQEAFLERAREVAGENHYVDMLRTMRLHRGEEIYFRTDPHWTALGAYYGYLSWWQTAGKVMPYYYDPEDCQLVMDDFQGAYTYRLDIDTVKERLYIFSETKKKQMLVRYDGKVQRTSYYREDALDGENPYAYFLGEGYGITEILTGYDRKSSLLVIGDSWANCMIPFLAPHYGSICFVSPSNYEGNLEELVREWKKQERSEILVLYSVTGLLEEAPWENEE